MELVYLFMLSSGRFTFILTWIVFLGHAQCPSKASIFDPTQTDKKDSTDKNRKHHTLAEADIMFEKRAWSFINFKEKLNKALYNTGDRKAGVIPLVEVLNRGILKGSIAWFKNSDFDSPLNKPLSVEAFSKIITQKDSIEERVIDENGNEKIIKTLKSDTLSSDKIIGIVIKEIWYFNNLSSLLEKRIIGLAPVIYDLKSHQQKQLFWVYYPKCCELFSSYRAYNPDGGKEPFSYYDLFEKKVFSSYVIRETNVYDRNLPENSKGMEVETETGKNKEKDSSKEEDTWPR